MATIRNVNGSEFDDRFAKAGGSGAEKVPFARWVGSKVTYDQLTAAATTDVVDLEINLPANSVVHDVKYNLVTTFEAASALSQCTVIAGDASDPNGLLATAQDLDDDGGSTGWVDPDITALGVYLYDGTKKSLTPKLFTSATDLEATFTLTGDNCEDLTQGEIDLYFLVSNPGAAFLNRATTQ